MNATATIHPTAVIEGDVQVGEGTIIDANVYIKGPVVIGRNNHIRPGAVIGTDGECRGKPSVGRVIIGDDNMISDLVTIHRGIGDRETEIGNNCFIMAHSYIAHDCKLGNGVTISPSVSMAGHVVILNGANIGIGTTIHQKVTIGSCCMIGMNSAVTKDILPFKKAYGIPAKVKGLNEHRIKQLQINLDTLNETQLYRDEMAEFEKYAGRK